MSVLSGSKLFAKVISRRQRYELNKRDELNPHTQITICLFYHKKAHISERLLKAMLNPDT